MKIERIEVENVLGIRRLDISPKRRVLFISGPNGAGKSSIAQAIRLALFDDPGERVHLKKEYGELVRDGAKHGFARVITNRGSAEIALPEGTQTCNLDKDVNLDALYHLVKPREFALISTEDRREFLFRLMQLSLEPDAIAQRLIERKCDADKIDAIAPLLRAGFEASAKESAKRATEAKGAWRGVTGENYGDRKAATWRASFEPFSGDDAAELHGIDKKLAEAEALLGTKQKDLGIAEHEAKALAERRATWEHLKQQASELQALVDKVAIALEDVDDASERLTKARQAAGQESAPAVTKHECPACKAALMLDGDKLVKWKAPMQSLDSKAAKKLPDLTALFDAARRTLEQRKQALAQAERAAEDLRNMPEPPSAAPAKADVIRDTIKDLQSMIVETRKREYILREAQAKLEAADMKTKRARALHEDVIAWGVIAEALSPDGIPGEMLSMALQPLNERLAQSALDTGWMQVRIGADMRITADGRRYSLLSRSEQWRTDAMIAEAIAYISGLRFFMLDEFDVLLGKHRSEALEWFDMLVANDEIKSAIVLSSLKENPELPRTMQAVWIENGEVERETVAA